MHSWHVSVSAAMADLIRHFLGWGTRARESLSRFVARRSLQGALKSRVGACDLRAFRGRERRPVKSGYRPRACAPLCQSLILMGESSLKPTCARRMKLGYSPLPRTAFSIEPFGGERRAASLPFVSHLGSAPPRFSVGPSFAERRLQSPPIARVQTIACEIEITQRFST
jgi:hypothetical protein